MAQQVVNPNEEVVLDCICDFLDCDTLLFVFNHFTCLLVNLWKFITLSFTKCMREINLQVVLGEESGHVRLITLNRPRQLNVISSKVVRKFIFKNCDVLAFFASL